MMQWVSYKKFSGYAGSIYHDGFHTLKNGNLLSEYILKYCWSPCIWRDGKRKKENFISAAFLVLDFDERGDETLEEINHSLQDHKRIIATTRNHQKEKNGVICDRFRLILPFDKIITDLGTYEYNMQLAIKKWPWCDKNAVDGARFFFPSQKIVYLDRSSEYSWVTAEKPTSYFDTVTSLHLNINSNITGKIPFWCLRFINDGDLGEEKSRNKRVFSVAFELFKQGFVDDDVTRLIRRAPIDWQGVNWGASIKDAKRKVADAKVKKGSSS